MMNSQKSVAMAGSGRLVLPQTGNQCQSVQASAAARLVLTARPMELRSLPNVLSPQFEKRFFARRRQMIHRVAIAILAGFLSAGTAAAQSTSPSGDKKKADTS